jgi:hemerythrin-like domain-containing protein
VLTLEELAKPENRAKARNKPRCEKHDKVLKFYCETCKVLVCRYSVDVSHPRPEHLFFPLADVVVQHKEALKTSSAIFEQQTNEAVQSNLKIEHAMETLKNNKAKAKDAIMHKQQEILNALTKLLEKETAALFNAVDNKYNEANKPLTDETTSRRERLFGKGEKLARFCQEYHFQWKRRGNPFSQTPG